MVPTAVEPPPETVSWFAPGPMIFTWPVMAGSDSVRAIVPPTLKPISAVPLVLAVVMASWSEQDAFGQVTRVPGSAAVFTSK